MCELEIRRFNTPSVYVPVSPETTVEDVIYYIEPDADYMLSLANCECSNWALLVSGKVVSNDLPLSDAGICSEIRVELVNISVVWALDRRIKGEITNIEAAEMLEKNPYNKDCWLEVAQNLRSQESTNIWILARDLYEYSHRQHRLTLADTAVAYTHSYMNDIPEVGMALINKRLTGRIICHVIKKGCAACLVYLDDLPEKLWYVGDEFMLEQTYMLSY